MLSSFMHVSIMQCHHLWKSKTFFFLLLYMWFVQFMFACICEHNSSSCIFKAKYAVKWKHDSIYYDDKRWIIVDWSLRKWYLILKFRVIPTRLNRWKYTFGTVDFTCTISQFTQRHQSWNGQRVVNDPSRLLTSHYSPQHWSLHYWNFQ